MKIRLNKYLSICGVSSRRGADELIKSGVVSINGEVANNLGSTVDPDSDEIQVRGITIRPETNRYIVLNKPKLYISALGEGQDDKKTLQKLLSDIPQRVYPVGRLDYDVEGLIICTNDGELANRVLHPSFELSKKYRAVVKGQVSKGKCASMADGAELEDGFAKPDSIELVKSDKNASTINISFHEGRNHLVKRFFAEFGNPVVELKRISVGPIGLGDLKRGRWRDLTAEELKDLNIALGIEN